MHSIHATDIETYLSCRRRFYLGNIKRIAKISESQAEYDDPLNVGTLGHLAIHAYNSGQDWKDAVENSGQHSTDIEAIKIYISQYIDFYKDDKPVDLYSQENQFTLDVEGVTLIFTPDKTYKINRDEFVIQDYKFYGKFPDPLGIQNRLQHDIYMWGLRQLGLKTNRFVYDVIKKAFPTMPEVLKNGRLTESRIKLSTVTYANYLRSIEMLGQDPQSYSEILEFLRKRELNNEHPFFRRYQIYRSDNYLNGFGEELKTIIKELKSTTNFYPHRDDFKCGRCQFKDLCNVMTSGGDTKAMLRTMYREKDENER